MKTRKFTKVISFILAIGLVLSTAVVVLAVSTYSTQETSYDCPRLLCSKNLMISGPYGELNETVDSSIPYLGGKTYQSINDEHFYNNDKDYHMYIVYCPKYNNSNSSLTRDTMTLMFAPHGYTIKSYTQYNASQHYVNKKCDHSTAFRGSSVYALTQHLCGENAYVDNEMLETLADEYQSQTGCGKETAVLEGHTWSYGVWENNGSSSYHTRTKTCIYCGYSARESDNHSTTTSLWTSSSNSQHKRTTTCSTCGYTTTEYANHLFTYGAWENSSDSQHKRTATCLTCGYSTTEYADHSLIKSEALRYGSDDNNNETYDHSDYHRYDITCSECDYSNSEYELHEMYVSKPWFDSDASYHNQITKCYHCSYAVSTYRYHNYPKELYTYVSLNATTHSITKHCDTCTRTESGGTAKHNFVVGEWTKFDSSDPNAGTYDCNKYHKRTLTCSDCGYVKYEYVAHNMYIDSYTSQNADRHSCVPKCSDCTYSYNLNEPHTFNPKDYTYEVIDKDRHLFIKPCEKCSYVYEVREYHEDSDSDCYCDDCGYLMTKFSVTVPTTMVLTMGTDGEVYAPSDVVIVNNSTAAVSVTKADVSARNGWNIVPYSTNMANEKVDAKKIGFKMNGIQTDSSGTTDSLSYNNSWIIEKDTSSSVVYDAVVSATSSPIDEQVIEIVYIVDWKE